MFSERAMNSPSAKRTKQFAASVISMSLLQSMYGCSLPVDWRADPPFQALEGGVCSADSSGARQFCADQCVDLNTDLAHCGACGNACALGFDCILGRCSAACSVASPCVNSGEICVEGTCVYAPPPPSVLSTNIDERDFAVRHAPEGLRLSAATSATFYYTVDGSRPMMGAPTTQMAMGQTVLINGAIDPFAAPAGCRVVQWFADYGAPLGAERVIHVGRFCFLLDYRMYDVAYETIDQLSLMVGAEDRGAIAVVTPGMRVNLSFRLRRAAQSAMMVPPSFSRIARVYLDTPATTTAPFCDIYNNTTVATPIMRSIPLDAPMTPGRYPIRLSLANDPAAGDCNGLNNLGSQRTLGVIIVP